jgi:hypothetical protein
MKATKAVALGAASVAMSIGIAIPGLTGAGAAKPRPGALAASVKTAVRPGAPARILQERTRVTVRAAGAGAHLAETASTSSNWSGYAVGGESYTYVVGKWKVPTATCASGENSQSSTWVGLDGWGDQTVEQVGSTTGCIFGIPSYFAWTEMYPALPVPSSDTISPGDSVGAYVKSTDHGTDYQLVMSDYTKGWKFSTTETSSPADQDLSAEWITEQPTCPIFCDNLTDFGSTTFHDAYATGNGHRGPVSSFTDNYAVDMTSGSTVKAAVTPLSTAGTSFTDRWYHS